MADASANPAVTNASPGVLLVAVGPDHPGILEEISHYAGDRRARIDGVKVVNLGGWFAMLMRVGGSDDALRLFRSDLQILNERAGLRAWVERPALDASSLAGGHELLLDGGPAKDAADEATTLRQASNLLRVLNVNISDVSTGFDDDAAPAFKNLPGERPPFRIRLRLSVPGDVPADKLRELLGQLLDGLGVRWSLGEVSE